MCCQLFFILFKVVQVSDLSGPSLGFLQKTCRENLLILLDWMQVEIPFFCVFISYTIVSENYFHTRGVRKDFFKEKNHWSLILILICCIQRKF